MAHEQAAGRDFGAFGDSVPAAMISLRRFRAIEDDAAHADQAARVDGAAVQDHAVADGDVVAEDQRMRLAHHVQHRAILHIRPRADADEIDVAANHGAGPDAGLLADRDVADDDGLRVNVSARGNLRQRPW